MKLKDSGTRQTYSTGAQKEEQTTEGKGRMDLLPIISLVRVAEIYRKGAEKYADRNWEKGLPLSRFIDSGLRHIFQYIEGKQDEDHLAQGIWNFISLLHTEEMINRGLLPVELDDLPCYMPEKGEDSEWRKRNRVKDGFLHQDTEPEDTEDIPPKHTIGDRYLSTGINKIVTLAKSCKIPGICKYYYIDTTGCPHSEEELTPIH
jgi:hypothetical protein